ncbi:MIP/aquaporin family protein [Buchnera aphidicola]|uniref:Aquaporin family protein n=1 Tax=Buchnera aphidicola subsp. Melaphis rhois TaxID=118103 RepID=A0A4D6YCE3_BUCMH|nr:MIP/aquaporin family protein [Buchnera aphidicola]QCI23310.1 aquaporin family protein [Buchnera aphidicola (Melaphis rhois)]
MSYFKKNTLLLSQCISEFLGTGLMIFFNSSCSASLKLTNEYNSLWKVSIILGLSTCIAIYISLLISGSEVHLNPVITVAFFLLFNFNKKKVIPYITSQILGSFFFSVITYKLYYNSIIIFEEKNKIFRGHCNSINSDSILSFFSNKDFGIIKIFIIEILITFVFVFIIIILNDNENYFNFKVTISPILIGILVCIINIIVFPLTNFTLNPAHDFGSRIFIYLSGWNKIVLTNGINIAYFIIPILGTAIGSVTSVYFYKYIKIHYNK